MLAEPKILVVDDKPENIRAMEIFLADLEAQIVSANSGQMAIEKTMQEEFAIALIDVQMPKMNGFETLQMIRKNEKNKLLPAIFITAFYYEDKYHLQAIESGGVDFISKPFHPEILKGKVNVFLELFKQKRQLETYAIDLKNSTTQLQRTKEILIQNEQMFRGLIENLQQHFIYTYNIDGQFKYISPSVTKLLGYTPEEFIQHYTTYMTSNPVYDEVKKNAELGVQGKQQSAYEVEIKHKDGQLHILDVNEVPVSNTEGRIVSIEGIARDITNRKRDEQMLRLQSSVMEATADAILITDRQGFITWVNPAFTKLTGYSSKELIGKDPNIFKSSKHDQEFYHNLWETILAGKTWRGEMVDKRKDGSIFTIEATITPVPDEQGVVRHFVAIVHDITKRKQEQEKQKELMDMKSNFISTVSHELRTPLTVIKEAVALVADGTTGKLNQKQKKFLDLAEKNSKRLARLINDVLDFQKIEAGRMEFNIKQNNINEIVRDIKESVTPSINKKGLELVAVLDNSLPRAPFDRDRITQVLTNIINNALKFTEKGTITITTSKKNNSIHVTVQDTGLGIKKTDIPKVFEEFEQLSTANKRKPGGTGLGLAISKQIIEKHNGKIWVDSKYRMGTTFHFTLPIEAGKEKSCLEKY